MAADSVLFLPADKGARHTALHEDRFLSSSAGAAKLAEASGSGIRPDQVKGLYLNITYDRQKLTCTTGTSLSVFTMDKSLEHTWDERIVQFFRHNQIPFILC